MRLKNIHVPPNLIPLEKKRRQKKRQKADYKKREGERVTERRMEKRGGKEDGGYCSWFVLCKVVQDYLSLSQFNLYP